MGAEFRHAASFACSANHCSSRDRIGDELAGFLLLWIASRLPLDVAFGGYHCFPILHSLAPAILADPLSIGAIPFTLLGEQLFSMFFTPLANRLLIPLRISLLPFTQVLSPTRQRARPNRDHRQDRLCSQEVRSQML